MKTRAIQLRRFAAMRSISTRFGRAAASHVHSTNSCRMHLSGQTRQSGPRRHQLSDRCAFYSITAQDLFSASSGASPTSGGLACSYFRTGLASIRADVPRRHAWLGFIARRQLSRSDTSTNSSMTPTPNHALQPTATLAFSCRSAALSSTGSVTACAPAMKPGTCRAFASRRFAHTRASGSRWLSLGSLGFRSPVL